MKSILFVCYGNISRSAMAEGIANQLIKEHDLEVYVDSAGLGHLYIGNPPCKSSQKVSQKQGIDISGLRARQITPEDKYDFDYVVAMDETIFEDLTMLGFQDVKKLGIYGLDGKDIPNPNNLKRLNGFEKIFDTIYKTVNTMFKVEKLITQPF